MSAHTPGPWTINPTVHADRRNIFAVGDQPFHIGTLVSGSRTKLATLDANARLIAAAPDLLEALKGFNITEADIVAGTADSLVIRVPLAAIQAAAAAVDKAEGRPA